MSSNLDDKLSAEVLRIMEDKKPKDVTELVKLVTASNRVNVDEVVKVILKLQDEGQIKLENNVIFHSPNLPAYLKTPAARWYWGTVGVSIAASIVALMIEDSSPLIYLRYALAAFFALWLIGYTFIRALFPISPRNTSAKNLGSVERAALNLGLSLALFSMVGLVLNYTPFGIRTIPLVLCLLALTTIFATLAVFREYEIEVADQSFGR